MTIAFVCEPEAIEKERLTVLTSRNPSRVAELRQLETSRTSQGNVMASLSRSDVDFMLNDMLPAEQRAEGARCTGLSVCSRPVLRTVDGTSSNVFPHCTCLAAPAHSSRTSLY